MINITVDKGFISVQGHANYAEHGKDIVCAGISTLVQVFIASVSSLTTDDVNADIEPGNVTIKHGYSDSRTITLLESFLLGVGMVKESYPEYIDIKIIS